MPRLPSWTALLVAFAATACGEAAPPAEAFRLGSHDGQWRSYGSDPGSTKYSSLDQIDAQNVADLEIAWTWTSADLRVRDAFLRETGRDKFPAGLTNFEATPLMVDGVLYGSTSLGQVFALDAGTGEELWVYDPDSFRLRNGSQRFPTYPKHRGVAYWRDGDDERIFMTAIDGWLIALDAKTGALVPSFGVGGRTDLVGDLPGPPAQRVMDHFQSSPPALVGETLVVGSSINDRPKKIRGLRGDIRGYDVRSGRLKWTFHTVPVEGEFGTESWDEESWRMAGAANAWAPMSVDPELGRVYISTSSATNDYYGGHRPGNGLFAETLLCLDGETGERIWHYQLVRHGLWDYDVAAPPNLVDITVDGRRIRAVAQTTKQGFTFVFDRVTGEPVWPIEDRPVPQSDVPGEQTAATQPFPTKPPPFERQGVFEDDLMDFTPELHANALKTFRQFRSGPLFSPPSIEGTLIRPGPAGGTNWQGAGVDPETGTLYIPSIMRPTLLSVSDGARAGTEFRYVTGRTQVFWVPHKLRHAIIDTLPLMKPPYSQITAVDLNVGENLWQVPNGDGMRDHKLLEGLDVPPTGSGVRACVLVTKTLLFASDGAEIRYPYRGRPILRAFDKQTGATVAEVAVPSKIWNCPMTYLHEGRQYIVVAVGDFSFGYYPVAPHDPAIVALALPEIGP